MKYAVYPHYKASGVEWLGDVPEHWEVRRLKTAAQHRVSPVDKVAVDGEVPVRLCNYTDVYYNERIRPDMELMETTATPHEVERFRLQVGDVLITKDSEDWRDIAIPSLVEESAEDLVCGYHLAIVRADPFLLDGEYLFRALQSSAVNQQFRVASSGVTRYGLPKSAIGMAWLPLPPLPEQRAIAGFLHAQTAKLDALIEKKRALIEKLQEKRAALISRTVTRGLPPQAARAAGLDPAPTMKDSGVEWLGAVPTPWELVRIGRRIVLQRGVDITKDEQNDGPVPVVSSSGVSSFHDVALAPGPGVAVGRKGTAGAVYYVEQDFWPHDTTLWVKDFRGSNPRFVFYKLSAMDLGSFDTGSANPTVNRNLVHPVVVSWPAPDEQLIIANYLDVETTRIARMIEKVAAAIERLQVYRSALITESVTGKIDVRETNA